MRAAIVPSGVVAAHTWTCTPPERLVTFIEIDEPMLIFERYLVKELMKVFLMALAVLTLMTTLGMGVKEGLNRGLPPEVIAETLPYMMPEMLGITIPIAFLLAVTTVFNRMAGGNEITALKAAGISPVKILTPVLLIGFVLSVVTTSFYELAAQWCRPQVQNVITRSIDRIAYGTLKKNRSFKSSQFSIAVVGVEDRTLLRPTITIAPKGDGSLMTFTAARARLVADSKEGGLRIQCEQGEIEVEGERQVSFSFTDEIEHFIPFEQNQERCHRDWLSSTAIPIHVERLCGDLERLSDDIKSLSEDDPEWEKLTDRLKWTQWKIDRLRTELQRRWANGFSCLCFAFIGAPVAMRWRFDSFLAGFFVCFLPILVLYYPLLMFQEDLTTSGTLPPVAFWMANLALLVPGFLLLRGVIRY